MTTARLLLRPLELQDARELYWLNLDPEVMKFVPDKPFFGICAARSFLQEYVSLYPAELRRCAVLRRADGAWLGWCGLKYDEQDQAVDLGFRFYRHFWGKGYATESAKVVLQHGFRRVGLDEVIARTARGNLASQRVLKKCGFTKVGIFENPDWNGILYRLRRPA